MLSMYFKFDYVSDFTQNNSFNKKLDKMALADTFALMTICIM